MNLFLLKRKGNLPLNYCEVSDIYQYVDISEFHIFEVFEYFIRPIKYVYLSHPNVTTVNICTILYNYFTNCTYFIRPIKYVHCHINATGVIKRLMYSNTSNMRKKDMGQCRKFHNN